MRTVDYAEFGRQAGELLEEVHQTGQRILIVRDGEAYAELAPIEDPVESE